MSLATANKGEPMGASSSQVIDDKPMVTLGLAAGITLLVSAGMMLAGFVIQAMFFTSIAFTVFVVAFVSAPLFARFQISWPTRAAVLGAILGWAVSAPLGALFNSAANVIWELDEPFEVLPVTWLWALIPLVVVMVVSGIRQGILIRDRY